MLLELKNVHKSFGAKHVLRGIGFRAESGQALGLLGRNGAGKTTTIRIIANIFMQDSGEVIFSDGDKKIDRPNVRIGYMPEERGLYPKKKIIDQMVYLGELRGMTARAAAKRAEALLGELEATEYINSKLETLSKGNQQKIQLAIALINEPDVVILDEPFSGLDPVNSMLLKKMIDGYTMLGKTVLFSSHQMSYVEEFCRHVCIINNGEIVLDGNLQEIKRSYPRNRIYVVPDKNKSRDSLIKILKDGGSEFITDVKPNKNGALATLKSEHDKGLLLRLLNDRGIHPDAFAVTEPSLEEIFVERAGGNEAV